MGSLATGVGVAQLGTGKRKGVASSGEELVMGRKLTLGMGRVMEMWEGMKRMGRDVNTIRKMVADLGDVMEGEGEVLRGMQRSFFEGAERGRSFEEEEKDLY